jgi:hypothetical protein
MNSTKRLPLVEKLEAERMVGKFEMVLKLIHSF